MNSFSDDEQTIVAIIQEKKDQISIDELSWRSGFSMNKLASLLLALELNGTLTSMPGKMYKFSKA